MNNYKNVASFTYFQNKYTKLSFIKPNSKQKIFLCEFIKFDLISNDIKGEKRRRGVKNQHLFSGARRER